MPFASAHQGSAATAGQIPFLVTGHPFNADTIQSQQGQLAYTAFGLPPPATSAPMVFQLRRPTIDSVAAAGTSSLPHDTQPQQQQRAPLLQATGHQAQPLKLFPADCTMVVESSQPQQDERSLLATWASAGAVSAQVTATADLAYINFSSSAQAAAAVDMLNSRQVSSISRASMMQRAVLKSSHDAHQQLSSQPYLAAKLTAIDEAHFKAAGILLMHRPSNGKPEVLLGHEIVHQGRLALLGGKREKGETSRITAAREFQEETAFQLQAALHLTPQQGSDLVDVLLADSQVIWVAGSPDGTGNSKYALYLVDISQGISKLPAFQHLQPQLAKLLEKLCVKFASFHQHGLHMPSGQREMQSLAWIPLSSHTTVTAPTHSLTGFLAKVVTNCQPLQQWALDTITEHMPAKLHADVKAAQLQAQLETPVLNAAVARLQAPIPPPAAPTQLTDLVTVQPGSTEYQHVKAMVPMGVHEIKRVVVPEREARFDAWRLGLPRQYQVVTSVSSPHHASAAL